VAYTKIGRQVTICINVQASAMTGTGNIRIGNFPFTNGGQAAPAVVMARDLNWSTGTYLVGYISIGETSMRLFACGDNINWLDQQCVNEDQGYYVNLTYFI